MSLLKNRDYVVNENKDYENYIKEIYQYMLLIFNNVDFFSKNIKN